MPEELTVEVVVTGDGSLPGRTSQLRLAWTDGDPLAVRLVVTPQPDHPALPRGTWVILRDFLRYALEERTGDGVVRLLPDPRLGVVRVELDRPERAGHPCQVELPMAVLRRFLDATEAVVPSGSEAGEATLDALVERLLLEG